MNVSVPLHPGPGPRAHLPFGDQPRPPRMECSGILVPSGPQANEWVPGGGGGRRPGEWIKGVGEDVTLDNFNGTLLLLKLVEDMDWCLGICSALSLFVFAL